MRVLIADRDGASLEILRSFLWEHGYDVEMANGLNAFPLCEIFSPMLSCWTVIFYGVEATESWL